MKSLGIGLTQILNHFGNIFKQKERNVCGKKNFPSFPGKCLQWWESVVRSQQTQMKGQPNTEFGIQQVLTKCMSDKWVHNPQIGDSMAKHIHRQTSMHETLKNRFFVGFVVCQICIQQMLLIESLKNRQKGENLKFPVTLNEEITTGNIQVVKST